MHSLYADYAEPNHAPRGNALPDLEASAKRSLKSMMCIKYFESFSKTLGLAGE